MFDSGEYIRGGLSVVHVEILLNSNLGRINRVRECGEARTPWRTAVGIGSSPMYNFKAY
jgi:hypothetical protein